MSTSDQILALLLFFKCLFFFLGQHLFIETNNHNQNSLKPSFVCLRLEAEIEEAHLKAKEEMMQGIQMAKEMAQKELSDQKSLYEDRIRALEKQLVHKTSASCLLTEKSETCYFLSLVWLPSIYGFCGS